MKSWLILGLVALNPCLRSKVWNLHSGAGSQPGEARAPTVQFDFERPALNVSYRFIVREDGSGTYSTTYPATPPATPAETVDAPLRLRSEMARRIFEQARSTVVLHGNCETKAKNMAQTGIKTLTYEDPGETRTTCRWNYSEKATVVGLQDEFLAMAATLDTGRRLRMEQRFDRLGMDREITFLLEEVKAGQAQGLENIAPILEAIIADTSLLERVRSKAKILLDMSRL